MYCVIFEGEKLVLKLKELEQKKNIVGWGRENEQQCLNNQYRTVVPQNYQKYEVRISSEFSSTFQAQFFEF